jgi:hypothetical protein
MDTDYCYNSPFYVRCTLTSASVIHGQAPLHLGLSLLRAVKYFISIQSGRELARFLEAVLIA